MTPRAPRRDAADNRAALVSAAQRALRDDPEAGLDAITAEAGLTRRALYGHFSGRDDLVRAVVVAGAERISATVAQVRHPDPLTAIALIADRLWAEVDGVRTIAVLAVRSPLLDDAAAALAPVRAALRAAVTAGVAADRIRTDIPAETLARLLESTAVAVLQHAASTGLRSDEARELVLRSTLSVAGLAWRDADGLAAAVIATER
jgi:AcrR family transcriptional regulator